MGEGDLKKLLDAERSAERSVQEAKDRSERLIRKAEEDALTFRDRTLSDFEVSRKKRLDVVKRSAMEESARVRKDGIALAQDLSNKAKGRMDSAVFRVLETIMESFQD
jgi:vacuolar-type H+-ATPase subunit H